MVVNVIKYKHEFGIDSLKQFKRLNRTRLYWVFSWLWRL